MRKRVEEGRGGRSGAREIRRQTFGHTGVWVVLALIRGRVSRLTSGNCAEQTVSLTACWNEDMRAGCSKHAGRRPSERGELKDDGPADRSKEGLGAWSGGTDDESVG